MGKSCYFLLLALLAGCSGEDRQPVEGKITFPDGKPVAGVVVLFECDQPAVSAFGKTDAEGNYRLGTSATGDGAPQGDYRVMITVPGAANPDQLPQRLFDPRFGDFETSGLRYTVTGGKNRFDIALQRFR